MTADVTVTDPKQFAEYRRLSGAAFEAHGIKPLAAVGTTERLEGREPGLIGGLVPINRDGNISRQRDSFAKALSVVLETRSGPLR
jgi:Domain of unknown function (DUF1330)